MDFDDFVVYALVFAPPIILMIIWIILKISLMCTPPKKNDESIPLLNTC